MTSNIYARALCTGVSVGRAGVVAIGGGVGGDGFQLNLFVAFKYVIVAKITDLFSSIDRSESP